MSSFQVSTKEILSVEGSHSDPVGHLVKQALFLAATQLDVAKLVNIEAGKILFTFVGHKGTVYRAHFSPKKYERADSAQM